MLTVTFSAARTVGACARGYGKMAAHLGGDVVWGMDRPIPLLEVLEVCGLDDALWALEIADSAGERDRLSRLLAADYAERVLPIFEATYPSDNRPRDSIAVVRRYACGEATVEELATARAAARDAAGDAWTAARAAAWAAGAAGDAAWDAAWAARDAAGDAAWDAERQWQAARMRQYLTGEVQPCE